ncbi:hypothetical protein C4D60_Mb05t29080 [Musa balbisiana]|uniref:Mo25 family protein n=1 Tax=Musa balbisiana TaxID=52838 RepID=A0A4V4H8J0_MUSBA|nr:hypothetical protein C4D60_Mb05t29080 [Musa balbisiana]
MSFFFKPSPRSKPGPAELAGAIKESFLSLDTNTFAKALEEVENNVLSMRQMLSGDAETEPNQDHISQLVVEICKGDVFFLFIHKLPTLSWEARKDLMHCWSILLRHNVDSRYCCVEYIENHLELLDFLIICYNNKEIALSCGNMLRECIKYPTLAKCILESRSFELSFKYVELPRMLLLPSSSHYVQFFELYEKLLTSPNYVTRRQSLKILSDFLLEPQNLQIMKRYILEVRFLHIMMALLKDTSKNIQISAFHIFKVFVANPNKPREIVEAIMKSC